MKKAIFILILCLPVVMIQAQVTYKVNEKSSTMHVNGTSTIHDWTMDIETFNSKFSVISSESFEINSISFSCMAESIKSEHSLMDSKTYDALKSEHYPNISFSSTAIIVNEVISGKYHVEAKGELTIAGVTKEILLQGTAARSDDNQIIVEFSHDLKMTAYQMKPPKAMMGAIVTGDEVTISGKLIFNQYN